jgi:transitional endoplasmic reticulum ATPase
MPPFSSSDAKILASRARYHFTIARSFAATGKLNEARENYLQAAELYLDASEYLDDFSGVRHNYYEQSLGEARRISETSKLIAIGEKKINENESPAEQYLLLENPEIPFAMVGGLESIKEILRDEVIKPYIDPEPYLRFDTKPERGIILYGPPGCGKTLMAKAVATESNSVFISPDMSQLKDKYVGESEKKLSDVFNLANSYEKAIVYLDELESLIPRSGSDHQIGLKNHMLTLMDGIKSGKHNFLVLGTTNWPWELATEVRRPGRFGQLIFIPEPDFDARKRIFEIELENVEKNGVISENVDLITLASNTDGYSGADISQICNLTKKRALKDYQLGTISRRITQNDFDEVLKIQRTSIIPWYKEALRSVKQYDEESSFQSLVEHGAEFLSKHK